MTRAFVSSLITLTLFASACSAPKTRIAVVGAGLSGLTATWQLQKMGFQPTLFEASDRVGGRVLTSTNKDGHRNELGGSFIDSDQEHVIRLCQELNVPIVRVKPKGVETPERVILGDKEYSKAEIFELARPALEVFTKDKKAIEGERLSGKVDGKDMTPTELKIDGLTVDQYLISAQAPDAIRSLVNVLYRTEYGMDSTELNALNIFDFAVWDLEQKTVDFDGQIGDEAWTVKGGNSQLIQTLASQLKRPVRFGHRLTAIKGLSDGYQLTFQTPEGPKTATVTDLIITVPLPILGNAIKLDIPRFPKSKLKAFRELQQGQNMKYFLYFKKPFWRKNNEPFSQVVTERFVVWDSTFGQDSGFYSLTIYLGGSEAVKGATQSEKAFLDEAKARLRKIYPDFDKYFVSARRGAAWPIRPLARGSYSGAYKAGQWALSDALSKQRVGRLYFAGEAWSVDSQGFMDGAVESARKAARSLGRTVKARQQGVRAR